MYNVVINLSLRYTLYLKEYYSTKVKRIIPASASIRYFSEARKGLSTLKEELGSKLEGKSVELYYASPTIIFLRDIVYKNKTQYELPLGLSVSESIHNLLKRESFIFIEPVLSEANPTTYLIANAWETQDVRDVIEIMADEKGYGILPYSGDGEFQEMDDEKLAKHLEPLLKHRLRDDWQNSFIKL